MTGGHQTRGAVTGATAAALIAAAVPVLRAAGVADPVRDARRLMAFALGLGAERLVLHLDAALSAEAQGRWQRAIAARAARQPVSQITGERLFWGRAFKVTPATLDPRPETECLVAAALEAPWHSVLDLGTGSGCILLTLLAERPAALGLGVDISAAALAVAAENAAALGLGARCELAVSDWFAAVGGGFDLIVANPPYIAAAEMAGLAPEVRDWEPALALSPGGDGLDAYRAIAAAAPAHLAPGGRIIVEIGPAQGAAVSQIFRAAGLGGVAVLRDLDDRDRLVSATRPREA